MAGAKPDLLSYSAVDISQSSTCWHGICPCCLRNRRRPAQQKIQTLFNTVLIHAGTMAAPETRENGIAVSYTRSPCGDRQASPAGWIAR
jgi:hypothetical protein